MAAGARRAVSGRPLLRGAAGALVVGEPLRIEVAEARISSVAPWSPGTKGGADVGSPDVVLGPGLSDSHAHLLAAAAARTGLDLSVDPPRDVAALLRRLRDYARRHPESEWLRARGYDEAHLEEGRPPSSEELEWAAPGRALRLRHATLHASLLSRTAQSRLPESLAASGDGLVVGQEEVLSQLCGDRDEAGVARELEALGTALVSAGVACVDDITASNDASRVETLADAVGRGWLPQRVRVWLRDADELAGALEAAAGRVEIAGVKLLPTTGEATQCAEFSAAIAGARAVGLPVAIHAVDPEVIDGALDALARAPGRAGGSRAPDRLEHCSLCPPYLVDRVAASEVAVVTQPGFLVARGPKYRREVEEPLWPWLYPIRSLVAAGVLVASGSDAPVIPFDPALGFVGATTRRSSDGAVFGDGEVVTEARALDLATTAAARVRGDEDADLDWLQPGARADFALLASGFDSLAQWRASTTIIGGRVYEADA